MLQFVVFRTSKDNEMYNAKQNSPSQFALDLIDSTGLVRPSDLEKAGISRQYVYRLCDSGVLRRIGPGLYMRADAEISENISLATVARRVPAAVVCLLSALRYHELTTQIPHRVWIALPPRSRVPVISGLALSVVQFSGTALSDGVEAVELDGVFVRITTPARTVVDCFKYRNKIGRDVAVEALRDAMDEGKATLGEIIRFAEMRRMSEVMRPYLEFYQ